MKKKNFKNKKIPFDKKYKKYAERIKKQRIIKYYSYLLENPHIVNTYLSTNENLSEELEKIRKKRHQLFEEIKKLPTAKIYSPNLRLKRKMMKAEGEKISFDTGIIRAIHQGQVHVNCADLEIGLSEIRDFRHYELVQSGDDGVYAFAFWPLEHQGLPNDTVYSGWDGTKGANFYAHLRFPGGWPFRDPLDYQQGMCVLQFQIPPRSCDRIIYWGLEGIINKATQWDVEGTPVNTILIEWKVNDGENSFPSLSEYEDIPIGFVISDTNSQTIQSKTPFEGGFRLRANRTGYVHIILSIGLLVGNGWVSTIATGGLGDHITFGADSKLVYFAVPDNGQPI